MKFIIAARSTCTYRCWIFRVRPSMGLPRRKCAHGASKAVNPSGLSSLLLHQQSGFAVPVAIPVYLFRGNDRRCGQTIAVFQMQQPYTLAGAPDLADVLGVDADDLAELADHHYLRLLVDQHDGHDLAVAGRSLDVDDALAAA